MILAYALCHRYTRFMQYVEGGPDTCPNAPRGADTTEDTACATSMDIAASRGLDFGASRVLDFGPSHVLVFGHGSVALYAAVVPENG